LECIGNTPVVRLSDRFLRAFYGRYDDRNDDGNGDGNGSAAGVNVYVKLESENPGGSIKDRLALGIIEWAERNGQLRPGQVRVLADVVAAPVLPPFSAQCFLTDSLSLLA
jgi:cysteine synthase